MRDTWRVSSWKFYPSEILKLPTQFFKWNLLAEIFPVCKNKSSKDKQKNKARESYYRCWNPVLEGWCLPTFRCIYDSSHLIQIICTLAGLCRTWPHVQEVTFSASQLPLSGWTKAFFLTISSSVWRGLRRHNPPTNGLIGLEKVMLLSLQSSGSHWLAWCCECELISQNGIALCLVKFKTFLGKTKKIKVRIFGHQLEWGKP